MVVSLIEDFHSTFDSIRGTSNIIADACSHLLGISIKCLTCVSHTSVFIVCPVLQLLILMWLSNFFATRILKTHTTRRFYFISVLGLRARL